MSQPFATPRRLCRPAFALLAAVALSGCPKPPPKGFLDEIRAALDLDADVEKCAETEYRAAMTLIAQAQEAYDRQQFEEAERYAAAAREQVAAAKAAALANAARCHQTSELERQVEQTQQTRQQPPSPEVTGPHEWRAIFFGFDSNAIEGEAARILDGHAAWLRANPAVRIRIEGHCDEAGSTEYNLALGERRARAVREYLSRLGVDASRVSVLSYGEEMPASESSDSANRRAEFVVRP
jgi:peptidoglycan-associated lipoprotein